MFGSKKLFVNILRPNTALFSRNVSTTSFANFNLPKGVQNPSNVNILLNSIKDNPGAKKPIKRVGRGIGSGRGKTSGRGHKGQKARSGGGSGPYPGFEGGQTPLWKKTPKFGFKARCHVEYEEVNLDKLKEYIESGRINKGEVITMKSLKDAGVFTTIHQGVKLLGRGSETFDIPINIEVTQVSKNAQLAIEKAGGTVKRVYYDSVGLKYLLSPEKFEGRVKPERATPKPSDRYKFDDWGQATRTVPSYYDIIAERQKLQKIKPTIDH